MEAPQRHNSSRVERKKLNERHPNFVFYPGTASVLRRGGRNPPERMMRVRIFRFSHPAPFFFLLLSLWFGRFPSKSFRPRKRNLHSMSFVGWRVRLLAQIRRPCFYCVTQRKWSDGFEGRYLDRIQKVGPQKVTLPWFSFLNPHTETDGDDDRNISLA